ncbi:Phage XkdN-like tail assembly chaperone protein, TAC [Anaerocolumna jejuensis DSM 15929]|uniref:Phage XkdN-like tail assembly chaperone protein, TAC n=1 Tax=Anaerocolumna jejuensis DSM 15929 TaxID=1121322 RepID=A0A1M6S6U7_9FIRM|nr:phage portal protein [Anaerocolumna jejuensis]SHK40463.1 Phage XkdN-like tail assembly chaperone protein, TAC [Anaerocolumna jejuensis DSM 15929]
MSSLKAFLNPVQVENKEVMVSNRFMEEGKVIPFIIRPITQKENEQLIKKYTRKDKKGVENFNRTEYVQALTACAVVFPNLNDTRLQDKYGLGETEVLKNMLLVGEYATLASEVQTLSGLDTDINEDIEEVKNE